MHLKQKNIDISYIQYGDGKDVILLHGWGQNIEMMKPLGDFLSRFMRVTILDFPGFGESEEPKEPWTIYDYEEMLWEFTEQMKIKRPVVIGHSFGGRVAIVYASRHPVEKLVLFGSPCVREDKKQPLHVRFLKKVKQLPGMDSLAEKMKKHMGSRDYRSATPRMREILVNVVNEDLSSCAKQILAPTLLLWGEEDDEAPLAGAHQTEALIPDAGLVTFPASGHYAYLENLEQVKSILSQFLL